MVRPWQVYLDVLCLPPGHSWLAGFINGLAVSLVFAPLLSWTGDGGGSLGGFSQLTEHSERVDNVLLEWILALELREHGGSVKSIVPVFMGHPNVCDAFPWEKLKLMPRFVHRKTAQRAAQILKKLGVDAGQIESMKQKSVASIVGAIQSLQGVQLHQQVHDDSALRECSKSILTSVKREISVMASNTDIFAFTRPMGHEVVKWLEENSLEVYQPIFALHRLDSLYIISRLSVKVSLKMQDGASINPKSQPIT